MAIKDILEAFENEIDLPVDLAKVKAWVCANSKNEDIEFVGVELDTGVIRGFLYRFTYQKKPYDAPIMAANIYYATNQEKEWVNIVCAKELIHATDNENLTGKKAQFDELCARLALPRELDVLLDDPAHVQVDKIGDIIAAGLLLPMAARAILMKPLLDGHITVHDISKMAMLPVSYVRMVMADRWERTYAALKTF